MWPIKNRCNYFWGQGHRIWVKIAKRLSNGLSCVIHLYIMSDKIPKVNFHQPQKDTFAFEVITLNYFFSRYDRLDPPLDKPHRVEFYQILYISQGEGLHYIDFKPYEYTKGSLLFISAGQVHAFDINHQAEGFLLLFTEDFLTKNMIHTDFLSYSRLYNYHMYQPDIPPDKSAETVFGQIFKEIYNEYLLSETFAREEMLRTLLKLLLLKAERIKQTLAPKEKNSEWVRRFSEFRNLISTHYEKTRNADAYADLLGISYNHLNKIVKAVTGSTAKAFIDDFIILECKRQLAVSDISVKELTYLMGFDEPTNFVKYFKKQTGLSPAQFKKRLTK